MGTRSQSRARLLRFQLLSIGMLLLGTAADAQICQTAADMEPQTRSALEATAKRYFSLAASGDSASLRQNSIASVASGFAGIEAAVKDNQPAFRSLQPAVRPPFLLAIEGADPLPRAEFLCGVFGKLGQTRDSAVFVLNNLPPGKYAVTILDLPAQPPMTLTLVLQQAGAEWKLAGFYPRAAQAAGHDAAWFLEKGREFKARSQKRNAWLYFREAAFLGAPVDFMSTLTTDRTYDEMQSVQAADLPGNGNAVDLIVGGKPWRLTEIFPLALGNDVDVVVKYQAADVSDSGKTYQQNVAVIQALVAKFPEFRDGFAAVVARAVEPSGKDYGTFVAIRDIK